MIMRESVAPWNSDGTMGWGVQQLSASQPRSAISDGTTNASAQAATTDRTRNQYVSGCHCRLHRPPAVPRLHPRSTVRQFRQSLHKQTKGTTVLFSCIFGKSIDSRHFLRSECASLTYGA